MVIHAYNLNTQKMVVLDQEFKASLRYIVGLWPAWATIRP